MSNPSSSELGDIPDNKPYKRHIWISVILTFLGSGLPLIYCGNLGAGIGLILAMILITYLAMIIVALTMSFSILIIVLILGLLLDIFIFIFNIRYTKKANTPNMARLAHPWLWIMVIFVIGIIVNGQLDAFIKAHFVEAYRMPSGSMEKTILAGDYLLASKGTNIDELQRGEIIIFKYPKNEKISYVKRLVAMSGDTIEIKNKQLYINHNIVPLPPKTQFVDSLHINPYIEDSTISGLVVGQRDNLPEQVIPPGKYFVLGDNRDNSSDSRYWGFVDKSEIVGIARFIHFSWDSEHWKIRWDRIGMRLDDYKQPS